MNPLKPLRGDRENLKYTIIATFLAFACFTVTYKALSGSCKSDAGRAASTIFKSLAISFGIAFICFLPVVTYKEIKYHQNHENDLGTFFAHNLKKAINPDSAIDGCLICKIENALKS